MKTEITSTIIKLIIISDVMKELSRENYIFLNIHKRKVEDDTNYIPTDVNIQVESINCLSKPIRCMGTSINSMIMTINSTSRPEKCMWSWRKFNNESS